MAIGPKSTLATNKQTQLTYAYTIGLAYNWINVIKSIVVHFRFVFFFRFYRFFSVGNRVHLDARNKHRLDIPRAGMRGAPHQFDIFISHHVGESLANAFFIC